MKKIELPGATGNLRTAGKWMIGNMQFNFPLTAVAAMNEMHNAAAMLMERPDLFRHTLKRSVKEALLQADVKKAQLMYYHNDKKAFDEYSDNVIDITEADFRMDGLLEAWRHVAEAMNPVADVLIRDDVIDQLKYITKCYSDGTYFNQCIDLMRHHPIFAGLKAEPESARGAEVKNEKMKNEK